MRIISRKLLREFWENHAAAGPPLKAWYRIVKREMWSSFPDLRKTFPKADRVKVKSGNVMTVFDVGGNKYRLITFINYDSSTVFTKLVLTHAEYDTDRWKDTL